MGIDRTLEGLQLFGFDTSEMPLDLSLALGSYALTPLEIATGYAMFANDGYQVRHHILDKIVDRDGNVIFQASAEVACDSCSEPNDQLKSGDAASRENMISPEVDLQLRALFDDLEKVSAEDGDRYSWDKVKQSLAILPSAKVIPAKREIDPQTAFLMDSMLKDVILRGTGVKAKVLNRGDIGGKTGTTNGPRDAWFSGYSPHLVATAWVGFDDNSVIGRNEYGGSAALPIWIDFMSKALKGKTDLDKRQPNGIVTVKIDPKTGKRVAPSNKGIYEFFRTKNVPAAPDEDSSSSETELNPLPDDIF